MIQLLIQVFQYIGSKAFFNFQIVSLCLSQHKQWKWKIAQAAIMNIIILCFNNLPNNSEHLLCLR